MTYLTLGNQKLSMNSLVSVLYENSMSFLKETRAVTTGGNPSRLLATSSCKHMLSETNVRGRM